MAVEYDYQATIQEEQVIFRRLTDEEARDIIWDVEEDEYIEAQEEEGFSEDV